MLPSASREKDVARDAVSRIAATKAAEAAADAAAAAADATAASVLPTRALAASLLTFSSCWCFAVACQAAPLRYVLTLSVAGPSASLPSLESGSLVESEAPGGDDLCVREWWTVATLSCVAQLAAPWGRDATNWPAVLLQASCCQFLS